ncbi:MAG: adenylate/guanylate cyclase domain-containing protein [Thermoplasmata archaeon]
MAATRRLAAVMFTDTVGYTASTQADEGRALDLLRQQTDLIRPLLAVHQGREIKSTGDGFLVEFDSALKATQCALSIQRRIYERNAEGGLAPIQIRIGIHLGDVVQSGADILGDAVNIAARIESAADPGGVCVSGAVHEQVRNKIPDRLEKLPPTALKGLQLPMEIYKVVLPWAVREPSTAPSGPAGIAILPFTNISPDPKDEYFADGLTEELITVLSQLRDLRVISRTSVMLYKATPKSVSQIGAELGVVSILEGSVRKAGSRLRVTAQLIDARSDRHLWAETYDRELDDVFAVQAEIARQVAEALKIELRPAEEARLKTRHTVRSDSYLAYLKGRTLFHRFSETSQGLAREQFELAISLDPNNAAAYAGLADATERTEPEDLGVSRGEWLATIQQSVARALELDPDLPEALSSLGEQVHHANFEYEAAAKDFERALALNPSYSPAHHWYAEVLEDLGRIDEALAQWALAEEADPLATYHLEHFVQLLIWLGRLDEARGKLQKLHDLEPDNRSYLFWHARYLLSRSDLEGALKELQQYEDTIAAPRFRPFLRAVRLTLAGEGEQARDILRREETLPESSGSRWGFVWAYCELGDLDACFRWVNKIIDDRAFFNTGVTPRGLRLDPRLEPIRRDQRFQAVLKKMKLT